MKPILTIVQTKEVDTFAIMSSHAHIFITKLPAIWDVSFFAHSSSISVIEVKILGQYLLLQ